jgi:hypothetical protein
MTIRGQSHGDAVTMPCYQVVKMSNPLSAALCSGTVCRRRFILQGLRLLVGLVWLDRLRGRAGRIAMKPPCLDPVVGQQDH